MNKNIVLIGMPGCGKTTIGKELASILGMKFIDIDALIEERSQKTISEIFKNGEECFRSIETDTVKFIKDETNAVISTGGGVIKKKINIDILKDNGVIIYIDRPLEKILSDIDTEGRPLLKNSKDHLVNLYNERAHLYNLYCDCRINNDGSIDTVISEILEKYKRL